MRPIFMFPSKCMDQSRHFNLFNNISRIKKLQANHSPKLVIYFCLSVDKSLYKPLLQLPAVPGFAGSGCASSQPPSQPLGALCRAPPRSSVALAWCGAGLGSRLSAPLGVYIFSRGQTSVSFHLLHFIPLRGDGVARGTAVPGAPWWSRRAVPTEQQQPRTPAR